MSEHSKDGDEADLSPEMKSYLRFAETAAMIETLIERGYSETRNLKQLKEEIAFELEYRHKNGGLTPQLRDELLDAYSLVQRLLGDIEKPS